MEFEELIGEMSQVVKYKEFLEVKDVILVIKPDISFFGYVYKIEPDTKKDWWDIYFTTIMLPPQIFKWILKESYINGEVFTMEGIKTFVKPVMFGEEEKPEPKIVKKHLSLIK